MHSWPAPALPPHGIEQAESLHVYDTAAERVVAIEISAGQPARMYVCGITPYDATHIGHAATYITFDLLNRYWRDAGLDVCYVQNVTDVDDPLLERANATGVDWQDLATSQIDLYRRDMTHLRVIPPEYFVSVIASVPTIATDIRSLVEAGAAYRVDEDWYFSTRDSVEFGEVSHLAEDEQVRLFADRGGDPDRPGKRDPLDSLLWRSQRPGEPSWPSALGDGRPGWHIECVSIAHQYLGVDFDVQGGGSDLAFPHHEMSAAQGRALTGERFARHFVHSALVAYLGEKMSKSRGNLVFVSELIDSGTDPMAIRLAILANHYRTEWEWTPELLVVAEQRLSTWRAAVSPPTGPSAENTVAQVRRWLADDLNTPMALQVIDQWCTLASSSDDCESAPGEISRLVDALLGIAL